MKILYFLLLKLLFIMPFYAATTESLEVRTIKIAPYGISTGGELSGIYYELAAKLTAQLGYKSTHEIYPYARIIHELKTGETDLTIMFKYDELVPYVQYIYPLPTLKNVVLAKKGHGFASIPSLEGSTIAYLRGAKFSKSIDENEKINKYMVTDFSQGLKMLMKDRVDAIIGPLQPIVHAAEKLGFPKKYFSQPLLVSERTPWLQISNKSLNKISKNEAKEIFSQIMLEGEYKEIADKYKTDI